MGLDFHRFSVNISCEVVFLLIPLGFSIIFRARTKSINLTTTLPLTRFFASSSLYFHQLHLQFQSGQNIYAPSFLKRRCFPIALGSSGSRANSVTNFRQSSRGNHKVEETTLSTAEEFERVAEEKVREASKQGIASQTTDKTCDAAEEAAMADSNAGSVKNRYNEHEPGTDSCRTRN